MRNPHIRELPYYHDSTFYFDTIAHLPWAVFLDSCFAQPRNGRFDVITAAPYQTLITLHGNTEIHTQHGIQHCADDPFQLLKESLQCTPARDTELPFTGGALGYFSYDLARYIEHLPSLASTPIKLPDMAMGIYDWAIVVDHQKRQAYLTTHDQDANTAVVCQDIMNTLAAPQAKPAQVPHTFTLSSAFTPAMSKSAYAQAFARLQDYIHAGDCYQANLAMGFTASYQGSSWHAYQALRQHNPAPYSAYLSYPFADILSCSPERFLQVQHGLVETKPIKGTRARSNNRKRDRQLAFDLLESEKDRAENLMIVDLLRNDLGKVCRPGSIHVKELFALESYPAVHHLVSTICGELQPLKHPVDLLRSCFPGGSITGTPKVRAMEIIDELETQRRGIYCGSIGYIDFCGHMDSNIAIRTLTFNEDTIHCAAGGAITADSGCDAEYNEALAKVSLIFKTLEHHPHPELKQT